MQEVSTPHTGLLRLGLATHHCVAFWCKATSDGSVKELCSQAERENWFPQKISPARQRYLVKELGKRFPYPARQLLNFTSRSSLDGNRLVCHWHLQLTDPLYRRYTSGFLLERWSTPNANINTELSFEWVNRQALAAKWKENTRRRLASGLLSAATEAGLVVGSGPGDRELRLPVVADDDIDYLVALLGSAEAEENIDTYLVSVGKSGKGIND